MWKIKFPGVYRLGEEMNRLIHLWICKFQLLTQSFHPNDENHWEKIYETN